MKKTCLFIALLTTISTSAQVDNTFGIKAGANYSQFRPDMEFYGEKVLDFQGKIGYYIGGFYNIGLSDKTSVRTELLLGNQGTKAVSEIYVEDTSGDSMDGKVKTSLNELVIYLPTSLRHQLVDRLFLEIGLQVAYALKRTETIKEFPFEPLMEGEKQTFSDFDKFDLGLNAGMGFDLTDVLELQLRYSYGVLERDGALKTSVISLGLGFKL